MRVFVVCVAGADELLSICDDVSVVVGSNAE